MHDDVRELRETLRLAREVEARALFADGCFGRSDMARAMRLRALHQMAREVAQEVEALTEERQREVDAEERMGRCSHCEEAPAKWGDLCTSCLRDAESGWSHRATAAHRASMERPTPAPGMVPWGEVAQ